MRCSLVLLGTSFDVGKFCTVLSQSCCAAFLPLVLSSLSCALLVIVQWLPGAPCFRVASWIVVAGVYRLALPARIVLFVFVFRFWVWFLIPAPGSLRLRFSAPPGLGCFVVVCSRLCPRAMISGKALAYLVGAGALVALATASPCLCLWVMFWCCGGLLLGSMLRAS